MVNIPFDLIEQAIQQSTGFCLACGEETGYQVEPDAAGYECEYCNLRQVYGAEEILIMGYVDTSC